MCSGWIHCRTAFLETREQCANTCGTQEDQGMNRGIRLSVLGVSVAMGLAVTLIVGWATPAWAPNCSGCSTSLRVPLEETVFVPLTDELVTLSGFVHVVIHVSPPTLVQMRFEDG